MSPLSVLNVITWSLVVYVGWKGWHLIREAIQRASNQPDRNLEHD